MLGADLSAVLADRDTTVLARADLDVTDAEAVRRAVDGHDVVINAAAYTRVDDAESHEDEARRVNAEAVGHLADAATATGARLVQFSTDYVFDGTATSPYAEDAPVHPVSAYGRTKAEGEALALSSPGSYVIRTAWLYGAGGPNFAKTMRRLAGERDSVAVVTDQVGQPTWTVDLARQTVALLDSGAPGGVYHGTNSGQTSWFDFARAVLEEAGLDPAIITPTTGAEFVRPAPRPSYSVLGHDGWARAGLPPMRPWREALVEATASGATDPSR